MTIWNKGKVNVRGGAAIALMACIGVLGGCTEDDASPETQANRPFVLSFKAMVGNEAFLCGKTYEDVGLGKHDYRTEGLRLYVSGVKALLDSGMEVTASLSEDGQWQHDNVALLDFGADCTTGEEPVLNMKVDAEVLLYSTRTVTGACFDVGIPFDRNHQGVSGALAPFDTVALFNSIKDGRTFLRLDGTTNPDEKPQTFNTHLKSTGCLSENANRRPSLACSNPNLARICLDFDPASQVVAVDIKPLLAGVDVSNNKDAEPGCYSAKNDSECTAILPALGIDFEFIEADKKAVAFVAGAQKVFRVIDAQ